MRDNGAQAHDESALPEGIDSAADLPKIWDALEARGYSSEAISKIAGQNLLRVFEAVQAVAEAGQPAI